MDVSYPEKLRKELQRARSLTDKPFAVNLNPTMDPSLQPMLDIVIKERVPFIETAGSRAVAFGNRITDADLLWVHKAHTVRHALAAERDGADAVCIMGIEGAGLKSPTMLTTLVSIAMAASRVKIPIIAAGGIGDARTFLGALALGAEAVLLGTVFCAVKESPLANRYKQALINADPYDAKWRDPILATPKLEDLQKIMEAKDTKSIMKAAGKAEDFGLPESAGTHTISLAIGYIRRSFPQDSLLILSSVKLKRSFRPKE